MKTSKFKNNLISCGLIITMVIGMYFFDIKCIFKNFFKIPCPSCGITRAWICVLNFNIEKAFEFNPVFWMAPILFILILFEGKIIIKKWVNTTLYVCVVIVFLAYWIYRIN
ncbi:MAG: DUF2752 domain-containing protein [Clostridia bacterium]|nr:DUF2752 domain-containing protein [Clostridia bacterium]